MIHTRFFVSSPDLIVQLCLIRKPSSAHIKELTKLDSSGDAKLNSNTLTFTVKVPEIESSLLEKIFERRQSSKKI